MTNANFAAASSYLQRGIDDKRREVREIQMEIDQIKRDTTKRIDELNTQMTQHEREAGSNVASEIRAQLLKRAQQVKTQAEDARRELGRTVEQMTQVVHAKEDEIRNLEAEANRLANIASNS